MSKSLIVNLGSDNDNITKKHSYLVYIHFFSIPIDLAIIKGIYLFIFKHLDIITKYILSNMVNLIISKVIKICSELRVERL